MIPLMSIARNFFMGREPAARLGPFGRFDVGGPTAIATRRDGARSASTCATRARRSARSRAASASAWRSHARSISAPGC